MTENDLKEKASPGASRAAALLVGLGQDAATLVFKQLGESEVRKIALGAKELKKLGAAAVKDALASFVENMENAGVEAASGDEVLRRLTQTVMGPDAARRVFESEPTQLAPEELLGAVASADPDSLAMVLNREQPQTIALVLSSLTTERAAQVMDRLTNSKRAQVVARMAVVEAVAPEVLREVRQALTSELHALVAEGMRKLDGRSAALEILRRTPATQQAEMLTAIEKDDPQLAVELRSKLFTFDDLVRLSDRDLQALMKDLDMKQVTVALKGASVDVKNKFLKNMSSRAAELLEDDLSAMGPVKLNDVEAAQGEVAKICIEAAEKGRITIVRPTDKML